MVRYVHRPAECWSNRTGSPLALCLASFVSGKPYLDALEERGRLLHGLGAVIERGDDAIVEHLHSLTPEEVHVLVSAAVPELGARLSELIVANKLSVPRKRVRPGVLPEDVPESMAEVLAAYLERCERRYNNLVKHGHERSHRYLTRLMSEPRRLAQFLVGQGITRWDVMRKRDVVAFMAAHPSVQRAAVERFVRYLNENKPFRDPRGRRVRAGKNKGEAQGMVVPPATMQAEQLKEFLDHVKKERSEPEFLMAWLVCRMGMMASDAHKLTLDRLRINDTGQLVIRPARVWVVTPRSVATAFTGMMDGLLPGWKEKSADELANVRLFAKAVPHLPTFSAVVLKGKARELRASAIYAAMRDGHLDRVTLQQTMGVSVPTIMKLEQLMSADLHRRLDPDFVKLRNKHILGEADE